MQTSKIALALLATAGAAYAQCNAIQAAEIRTFSPWQASFYYLSTNGATLNQYVDVDMAAPLTINQIFTTTYNQGVGNPVVPDQQGNVAEVRIYTCPTTHVGSEATPTAWTQVATGEMTVVAWNGDCPITNFKDPATGAPFTFTLPQGQYGVCIEYIPTTWQGTANLPQTNVPLLNPGELAVIGFSPLAYPDPLGGDQFIQMSNGGIQTAGWQVVDAVTGALAPNATIGATGQDQPNIAFDYTPDPASGASTDVGGGCYDLPFMIYEQIANNTTPGVIGDVAGQAYTALLTPSANGGFYQISNGGIPYLPPPAGATNLTQGNTAAVPVANSGAGWDDATASYTPIIPIAIPSPNGGLQATELGINTNGRIYFDVVPPSDTSFTYNGSNYGAITGFRDFAAQWAIWQCDLDPVQGGDIYVMEPSPNLGGVMIWWDAIPNYPGPANGGPAGETSSFSIEFTPDGSVVNIAYGADLHNTDAGDTLIGFSAGNGEPVGGLLDWSAIPALPGAAVSGDGSKAPALSVAQRPIAGNVVDLVMGDLPAGITGFPQIGIFALNVSANPVPVDLGIIGAPGCNFYPAITGAVVNTAFESPTNPGTISQPLPLPASAVGVDVWVQGGVLNQLFPANSLGITFSNGVCLKVGQF
ncbi:MAG: hypothetical protein VXY92_06405 [Planctomycetota bacterium]|nr:hypothetical protein [Planctomycetota bacterium]